MISKEEKLLSGILPDCPTPCNHTHSLRPNLIDLSLNYNNIPHKSNAVIVCTSHRGHLTFLRNVLQQLRKTGKFLICSYDPPATAYYTDHYYSHNIPDLETSLAAHMWVHKHITYEEPKRNGWFWDVRYAQGIIKNFENFEYIFTVNGDCIWEKPEGVDELIALMGDNDLMAVTSDAGTIHTCAVLFRREAFMIIMDYMAEYHKTAIIGSYSPERLLLQAVRQLGFKEFRVPNQPVDPQDDSVDHYTRYRQPHTWNDIVGYRNLGAEWLTALIERFEPPEKKYINFKFFETIFADCSEHVLNYYKTGDRRYLYMAGDRNEDSWYDRVYYPLERYGREPIMGSDPESDELFNFNLAIYKSRQG